MLPARRRTPNDPREPVTDGGGASRARTVSVVIPVKDDADMLRRCLDALAAQTRPIDEIIVVDNNSTDRSAEVARAAGARVIVCERPGIAAAAATGYDASAGEYVLRLDADCVPGPDWARAMVDDFARRPDVGVLTAGARFIEGPRMLRTPLAAAYLGAYVAATIPALGHLPLFGSNLAFRRAAWSDIRSRVHVGDDLHDDLDLAFHFGERHRIRINWRAEMGISMRPFTSVRGWRRRVWRGVHTVVMHWPHDVPPVRATRRALRRVVGPVPRGRDRRRYAEGTA